MDQVTEGDFLEELEQRIRRDYPPETAGRIVPFARELFQLFPIAELADEPINDVVGFVGGFWVFMQKVDLDSPKIRIFNPTLEEDNWISASTNIFLLQRDMPFIVDSVRLELNRRGFDIQTIKSRVFRVARDQNGNLQRVDYQGGAGDTRPEAAVFIQTNLFTAEDEQADLKSELAAILGDVGAVTDDYQSMVARLDEVVEEFTCNYAKLPQDTLDEVAAFLQWVRNGHFTFLGSSEYLFSGQGDDRVLSYRAERQLGIFRHRLSNVESLTFSELNPGMQAFYDSDEPLVFTKSSVRSRVHRAAHSDYIVIKRYDPDGAVIGEYRFMGLYTSPVYTLSPFSIPLIRRKVERVMSLSGLSANGHDGKALRQLIEVHPRDELFHSQVDELFRTLIGIWQINERRKVRFFMRPDPFGKFISCLVYMPKDVYSTEVRLKIEHYLVQEFEASESEFTTYFPESILARTHFIFRIHNERYRQADSKELEHRITHFTHDWSDDLAHAALEAWGDEQGRQKARRYRDAFPASYRDHFDPRSAVHDIELFETLKDEKNIAMMFYQPTGNEQNIMRFKLFHRDTQLELSLIVPMLENLGFRVLGEHPYRLTVEEQGDIWLHDFTLRFGLNVQVDVSQVRGTFQEAFAAVWSGETENDSFNKLVVGARLDWRSVAMLRLYARYFKQLGTTLGQSFIADTLATHLEISRNLVALFRASFDPRIVEHGSESSDRPDRLRAKVTEALVHVANLNEDQVLRNLLELISATRRTNFFQTDADGNYHGYLSVKLAPREITSAPEPRPLYEIFVYSPRFEGVHLRAGKVARGGIRWSDRLQDYRTEVLGLVKAQQVKNAVIVPTGAKGGFVAKQLERTASREAFLEEGVACYRLFIQGLLDITDNIIDGEVVPPASVVIRDDPDPYLVVAADKGTATFSDIANEISGNYKHWLGDAFASGGSQGYDHKKMGITARGAWVAVQRHFRELGRNTQTEPFTVIGIGDMAGDVFGNGMLLSEQIRLLVAFNHLHIFIDPEPDAAAAFAERTRLFELPRSSWDDYDRNLISPGGGVFSRQAKSISLTPEIRSRFGIDEQQLTPTALIQRLLLSEVDLIWNGGIGTYVKASTESHQDVGDRVNDSLRVDGRDLKCKVFGEGGNLGMTQRGRIEFCLAGGACNTDFIDNAAGVDCSDHEVNIKILLNALVANQDLTPKQRNQLLVDMTDDVARLVLHNNYRQTQAITLAREQCLINLPEYWRCMSDWEAEGKLRRKLEFLPNDETMVDRTKTGNGLTRPELAVLVSYAKILLNEALLDSDVLDDPYIARALGDGFPELINNRYSQELQNHSLRREIIANQLANEIINLMGLSFPHRQADSTGASIPELVCAYVVARDVFHIDRIWSAIEALDYEVKATLQSQLMLAVMRLGRRTSRWILRNRRNCLKPAREVEILTPLLAEIDRQLPNLLTGELLDVWQAEISRLTGEGVSDEVARIVAGSNSLYFGLGIADISTEVNQPVELVAEIYFSLGVELELDWFADQIVKLTPVSRWEDFARESFVDDLELQRRSLTRVLLGEGATRADIEENLDQWRQFQQPLIQRWQQMVHEIHSAKERDFSMFSVALRELLDLVQATENSVTSLPFCQI